MHKPSYSVLQLNWDSYLLRHIEWGWLTFGTPEEGRGPRGPLDHALKEVAEIEASPKDIVEWIDAIILTIDGYFRAKGDPDVLKLNRIQYLATVEHQSWPKVLKSLKDTLNSLLGNPYDVELWRHAIFLSIVGYVQLNDGKDDELMVQLFAKQRKNFNRTWPDWRKSDPDKAVEHVRGTHD
jgi:hypothetical protein